MLATAFSLIVHHDCSRSQASYVLHAQARERLAFVAAHRCSCARERLACGLRSISINRVTGLPCSRTPCFQRCSFLLIPATALRSRRRTCLQQPCAHSLCTHRPSSSLILSSIVRSSTLKLENFLHLLVHMLMLENALRSSSHMLARALYTSFLSSLLTLARFVGSSHLS